MNFLNISKDSYKLSTRNYSLNFNNLYKIPSIGLIKSFKIINYNKLNEQYSTQDYQYVPVITIGNFTVYPFLLYKPESIDTINVKDIRNSIRDIFSESDYQNKAITLEASLFTQQLKSLEYYYTLKKQDISDSLFTSGINVYIEIQRIHCSTLNSIYKQEISDIDKLVNELEETRNSDYKTMDWKDISIEIEETYWDKVKEEKKEVKKD